MKWLAQAHNVLLIAITAAVVVVCPTSSPLPIPNDVLMVSNMELLGSDEFDGIEGSAPDSKFWTYDIGGGGWGNNEKQVYTDSRKNSRLDGNGSLIISALRNDTAYTSARLVTRGKFEFETGLLEARIKFPSGQGVHPAFWLLGSDIGSVGWPACGEIDGMELVNTGTEYHNAVHGPQLASKSSEPWKQSSDGFAGVDLSADFHNYGIYREPGLIVITIDRKVMGTYRASTMPPGARWVFDAPMYLTLNIAIGGKWPGPPTSSTQFPANMVVDWVRYSRQGNRQ